MVLKNLFAGNNGETENRFMDMGRGEERARCMERVTWKLTFPIAKGNLLNGSGNSKGLCISLEGLDGEGDGREVQKGGDMFIYG